MQVSRRTWILKTVLKKVTPQPEERAAIESLAERLKKNVVVAAHDSGLDLQVRVEGSVAKDTWLSKEPDIDVFMRVPQEVPRGSLGKVSLEIARKATRGSVQVERFAEHPYLEAFIDGVRVNIVPCYEAKLGEWLSATDRTPFHTDYVVERLNEKMRDDVRLLKKFMKGIGSYGAEIKIGGFSGYLCELIVLHYGSFGAALKAFAGYNKRIEIDIEGYYSERADELVLLFGEPLVVIDPIDKGRNVASAVRKEKLDAFVAASRQFLKTPKIEFFYPPRTIALSRKEMKKKLKERPTSILVIVFSETESVPDILWGQLYKSLRSLLKLLSLNDFIVLRASPWSDTKTLTAFVFELERHTISGARKHLGPPLERAIECDNFLKKHQSNDGNVAGPYLEAGRWVVLLKRKHTEAAKLLEEKLRDGGRNAGIAEALSHVIKKGFRIKINEEIIDTYSRNDVFAEFLTEFLSAKPKWLTNTRS
jgi:tRNA nucleotidyltransferase (CCA-adding enzyme)